MYHNETIVCYKSVMLFTVVLQDKKRGKSKLKYVLHSVA